MSKPFFRCLFFLTAAIVCRPLFSAGNAEKNTDTRTLSDKGTAKTASDTVSAAEAPKETADEGKGKPPTGSALPEKKDDSAAPHKEAAGKPESSGTGTESADTDKKTEDKDSPDTSFSSIQSKGLTVAEGTKWYYENFDRLGRSVFAVEYENGLEIEKILWSYQGESRHPTEKKTCRTDATEIIRYDDAGRVTLIETYDGKKALTSKTENTYNTGGQLIEQTLTAGKNTDKSVWDFVGDKAVSQTKYRNGKKTAFIELHSDTRIVHLYADEQEVLVTEEE